MRAWVWAALLLASGAAPLAAQRTSDKADFHGIGLNPGMYMDTAALRAALATLPARPAEMRLARVFRIAFDSANRPLPTVPAAPTVMPRSYSEAVIPLIQAALRPMHRSRGGSDMLVLVETGSPARIEQVYLPEQQARVTNPDAVSLAMYRSLVNLHRADSTLAGKVVTVQVVMRVSEAGVASSPRLIAPSGIAGLDEAALRLAREIRFEPALLDGVPVPTKVTLPLHCEFPTGREPRSRTRER